MIALDRRDRRALWLGALILVPVIAWRGIVTPIQSALDRGAARVEASAGLLAREQALLRDGPRLPAALAAARARLADEAPRLFRAADTVNATMTLGAWVRGAARGAGLADTRIAAAPVLPGVDELLHVQVDVRGQGTMAAVAAWLQSMESGERLLAIERFDLSAAGDGLVTLDARVSGFAITGGRRR